jgi:hypothetical protein
VRNPAAAVAVLVALLSLGTFVAAGWVAQRDVDVTYLQAAFAIPLAFVLALASLSLSNRARDRYQRSLGRSGGAGLARFARLLGLLALLITATTVLALIVYWVLEATDGLQQAPW